MEKKKISLVTFVICMLAMVLVIGCLVAYIVQLKNTTNEQKVKDNINNELQTENKSEEKFIKEVSYIEIQVDNSGEDGLSYTEPLRINDKEVINKIIKIINNHKDITITKSGGFFESCPIVTIHQTDGTKVNVIACDNFQMEGEPSGNLIGIYTRDDASDKGTYQVDEELGKYLEEVYNNKTESTEILSHKDIMKTLYLPDQFSENGNEYTTYASIFENQFYVRVLDDGIYLDISNTEILNGLESYSCKISGISEEVVDMELYYAITPYPLNIIFLTREGNVYSFDVNKAIVENITKANKVTNVSDVIKIDVIDCLPEDAMEGTQSVMIIKADGSYEDITNNL